MLADLPSFRKRASVLRLASVPDDHDTIERRLLVRGIHPGSVSVVVSRVLGKTSYSAVQFVDNVFVPRSDKPTPFRETRFGDGTIPVYYSALEVSTCKAEVVHHLRAEVSDPNSRIYRLIECSYDGLTKDLRGQESRYPDLICTSESGYPFCRDLGRKAANGDVDGFFTMSARRKGGTCVPVFKREAISNPRVSRGYRVAVGEGRVAFEELLAR